MTGPRMWKCNVYTLNHVPTHRAALDFASQLPVPFHVYASAVCPSRFLPSTLAPFARASCTPSVFVRLEPVFPPPGLASLWTQRVFVPRAGYPLKWMLETVFGDGDARWLAASSPTPSAPATYVPPSDQHANSGPVTRAFSHPERRGNERNPTRRLLDNFLSGTDGHAPRLFAGITKWEGVR